MRVMVLGNYPPDQQESMLRYGDLVQRALGGSGVQAELVQPARFVNRSRGGYAGISRYAGYVDKLGIGTPLIRRHARHFDVVHVADHSNSFYCPRAGGRGPVWVATVHDLIAVRIARGELSGYPVTALGRYLQEMIVRGLRRVDGLAPVSSATRADVERIIAPTVPVRTVPNALNHPYAPVERELASFRLQRFDIPREGPLLLHVGNNHPRKNRMGLLRALRAIADLRWNLVVAGHGLSSELWRLADELGLRRRIREVIKPSNEELEALYSVAAVTTFPSTLEGFGWPVVEAQACGSIVACSGVAPLTEVSGGAAIHFEPGSDAAIAAGLRRALTLAPSEREALVRGGLANAARYSEASMAAALIEVFEDALQAQRQG